MVHYGTLRDYRFSDTDADDIRGSKLYGLNDEKLGKIDDVIFDHTSGGIRYIVVDTGGWLSSKKFIVPADRLRASAEHEDDFQADLNKQQIERFSSFEDKLRQRRAEIISGCSACGTQPSSERLQERDRKAG